MAAKCKTPGRKRAKRPLVAERKPLDDELIELAEVLAEYRLDNNANGWFRPAWRDGWNAVELAFEVWRQRFETTAREQERGVARYFSIVVNRRLKESQTYLQVNDDASMLNRFGDSPGCDMLLAALRCYCVLAADSSGGGWVYNNALMRGFAQIDVDDKLADSVLEWRCLDAIGTTVNMRQDANDRLRRAFATAWRRGLYLAAYSLPPAIDFSLKPTLVKP